MTACRLCLAWLLCPVLLAFGQTRGNSVSTIGSLLRTHHPAQALRSLHSALQASPNDANLWTLKGIALSMQDNNTGASSAFKHALRLAPKNLAALRGEVQILDQRHDPGAVALLHRILTLSPGDTTAHEMLALYEQRDGNCVAAIPNFRKSGSAMQRHPGSLAAYGSCLKSTGHIHQAISVF